METFNIKSFDIMAHTLALCEQMYKHTHRRTYEMSSSNSEELTSNALAMATTPSLLKPLLEMLNTFIIWLLCM